MGNDVARLELASVGGRSLDGSDHLDSLVLEGDLDPQPAKFAARGNPQFPIFLGVQIDRVRVQGLRHGVESRFRQYLGRHGPIFRSCGAHAFQRRVNEPRRGNVADIFGSNPRISVHEVLAPFITRACVYRLRECRIESRELASILRG